MDLDEIVCTCTGVTAGEIREAVLSGADTVEAVQEATSAGSICGGCIDRIEELIDEIKQ